MNDDMDTVQMPAVTADDQSSREDEADQTLTDEFQIDQDVGDNEATRRLDSEQLPSVRSALHSTQNAAAVPGDNSTMPLPAVSASKTEANQVPEAVLAAMRAEQAGKATTPARPAIKGESVVKGQSRTDTIGPDDETVDRAKPVLGNETQTEEQYPAVSFFAEIDGDGKIFIPRQYMGLLRFGQKVAVRVQAVPDHDQ